MRTSTCGSFLLLSLFFSFVSFSFLSAARGERGGSFIRRRTALARGYLSLFLSSFFFSLSFSLQSLSPPFFFPHTRAKYRTPNRAKQRSDRVSKLTRRCAPSRPFFSCSSFLSPPPFFPPSGRTDTPFISRQTTKVDKFCCAKSQRKFFLSSYFTFKRLLSPPFLPTRTLWCRPPLRFRGESSVQRGTTRTSPFPLPPFQFFFDFCFIPSRSALAIGRASSRWRQHVGSRPTGACVAPPLLLCAHFFFFALFLPALSPEKQAREAPAQAQSPSLPLMFFSFPGRRKRTARAFPCPLPLFWPSSRTESEVVKKDVSAHISSPLRPFSSFLLAELGK